MTREEAIKELKESLETLREYDIAHLSRLKQALEMAIRTLENHDTFMKYAYSYGKADALSQEPIYYPPCEDCNKKMDEIRRAYDKLKEQEPCDECRNKRTSFCGNCKEYDEYEPCDDVISRDELLKAVDTWDKFGYTETGCFVREPKGDYVPYIHYDDVIKSIKGMPSVTQKSGKWITDRCDMYICSKCNHTYTDLSGERYGMNFCPNCGAKMENDAE